MLAGVLAAIVLLVLTVLVLSGHGTSSSKNAAALTSSSSSHASPPTGPSTPPSSSSVDATTATSASSPASPASSGAALAACLPAQLTVSAASSAPSYKVGDEPVLSLQVVNNGPANCTQDLADSQVELRVYNGAARVWGSHDCLVQPGTSVKTLVPGMSVMVQVTWSGLSSQPSCAGTRQRVGAGTYTLFPYLSGTQGTAAMFSIS
jgi:hypothetical protein